MGPLLRAGRGGLANLLLDPTLAVVTLIAPIRVWPFVRMNPEVHTRVGLARGTRDAIHWVDTRSPDGLGRSVHATPNLGS